MNAEFFAALEQLEKEKGIPQSYMLEKIEATLLSAFKKEYGATAMMRIDMNTEKKKMKVYRQRTVVEEVLDPACEITLEEAKTISKRATLGGIVENEVKTENFRRLSAAAGKSIFIQAVREGEHQAAQEAYRNRKEEIMTATVSKVNLPDGAILLELDEGSYVLPEKEQIPGETYVVGQKLKVFVTEINKDMDEPAVTLSRFHQKLVWRLFELEVPEIQEGVVLIKGIAREPGSRTKIAVMSRDPDVDALGACIGNHNMRLNNITSELNGERIDIIIHSEVPEEYIAAALQPADVNSVTMIDERSCVVKVDADQLSLAIGIKGQNVRLAAKLTGYKIDIKAE